MTHHRWEHSRYYGTDKKHRIYKCSQCGAQMYAQQGEGLIEAHQNLATRYHKAEESGNGTGVLVSPDCGFEKIRRMHVQ